MIDSQRSDQLGRLAKFFKYIRKEMGVTQKELAEMTGTNLKVIRAIEQGHLTVHLYKLQELMDFLGYELIPIERKMVAKIEDVINEGENNERL